MFIFDIGGKAVHAFIERIKECLCFKKRKDARRQKKTYCSREFERTLWTERTSSITSTDNV